MPGGNGMGPLGEGAMTGRKMGKCVNPDIKANEENLKKIGQENRENFGFGRGMGFGRGLGCRRGFGRGMGFGRNTGR